MRLVVQDPKGLMDLWVLRVVLVLLGCKALLVQVVHQALKVPLVPQVVLDLLGQKALKVLLVRLDPKEPMVPMATKE